MRVIVPGTVMYCPFFFTEEEASILYAALNEAAGWSEHPALFNRDGIRCGYNATFVPETREFRVLGPQSTQAMSEHLVFVKRRLDAWLGRKFNSVIINFYVDGGVFLGPHGDVDPEMGENPVIATVSFGATRPFQLKSLTTGEGHEVMLEPGSIIVMQGDCQRTWFHGVPPVQGLKEARLSLTFREVNLSS